MIIHPAPNAPGGVRFHSLNGHSWQECRDYVRSLGLLYDQNRSSAPGCPEAFDALRQAEQAKRARVDAEHHRVQRARTLWDRAEAIDGTPAERYLREARRIECDLGTWLGYLPEAPIYPGDDRPPFRPALVAPVCSIDGGVRAVHLTYLETDGSSKAAIKTPRKMLGPVAGCAVHIGEPDEALTVCEGIETALSYADVHGGPVWAALSTSGMANCALPAKLRRLAIGHDQDANGAGRQAALRLAKKATLAGVEVVLRPPPEGFNDWNDAVIAYRMNGDNS